MVILIKPTLNKILLLLLVAGAGFSLQESFAETIGYGLGTITDLNVGADSIYYFETDVSIQSPTWAYDTQVKHLYDEQTNLLSKTYFIYPTELNRAGEFLVFATLSDACMGQIICDFQNVVKMSTKDGSFEILDYDLKSAIHISIYGGSIYVSESHGAIWKMDMDGSNKQNLYAGSNIIMDMAAHEGFVYWIEEVGELENRVLRLDEATSEITVIDDHLSIPYGLKVTFGKPIWSDVRVKPASGLINDFTLFRLSDDGKVTTIAEFKNTSPVAQSQSEPHYRQYFVHGDYIIASNNTSVHPVIQLINYRDGRTFDIETVEDYTIGFFRSDHQNLYVVGQNDDGFLIEKFTYPVTVPEFGPLATLLLSLVFVGVIFAGRLPQRFR